MRVYTKATLVVCAVAFCGRWGTGLGATEAQTAQPAQAAPKAEPTPVGVPFGDQATAVIGPSGGTLKSADDAATLEVPPGAVAKNTTFAVQTITNEAHGRIGDAFRITPEGTTFAVPARLTFRYTEEDVLGSSPSLLRVGYQDKKGYWRLPKQVAVDEKAHTVSVLTTHLSDWSSLRGAQLLPHSATVPVGKTVSLRLVTCTWVEAPASEQDADGFAVERLVSPCTDTYYQSGGSFVDHWSANSIVGGNAVVGIVGPTQILEHATYVAPANAPKGNPVAVSVDYHDPGSKEKQGLVSRITVIDPKTDCQELRNTEFLKGGMTFAYNFSGTGAQGHQYAVSQGTTMAATLKRVPDNNLSTWVWRGPAQADGTLHDSLAIDGVTQRVTGNGGFLDSTYMVVTVRVKDCAYTVAAEVLVRSITTMEVAGQKLPQKGNTRVGGARTGFRPVKGGMSGSGDFWVGHGPDDTEATGDYSPGGFGKTLSASFKPGDLSKAEVTWAIAPVRPNLSN
jgi:hypothetical protein